MRRSATNNRATGQTRSREKENPPRFILASASPRRQQLLTEAGLQFEVVAPQAEEVASSSLTVRELTAGNAARKAMEVARVCPDAIVLAADTLVALDGELI